MGVSPKDPKPGMRGSEGSCVQPGPYCPPPLSPVQPGQPALGNSRPRSQSIKEEQSSGAPGSVPSRHPCLGALVSPHLSPGHGLMRDGHLKVSGQQEGPAAWVSVTPGHCGHTYSRPAGPGPNSWAAPAQNQVPTPTASGGRKDCTPQPPRAGVEVGPLTVQAGSSQCRGRSPGPTGDTFLLSLLATAVWANGWLCGHLSRRGPHGSGGHQEAWVSRV